MAQLHPALAETANYIAKAVEEEAAKPSTAPHPVNYNDNNYSYHMEDFTDDEEMDSSQVIYEYGVKNLQSLVVLTDFLWHT